MKRILIMILLLMASPALAQLQLDNIQFDPAIIAAGDEVDIVIQYRAEISAVEQSRLADPDYRLRVTLLPDDRLTREYVLITDDVGDDLYGSIFPGGHYNRRFRIKVLQDAPPATYQFMLRGEWYHEGKPTGEILQERFRMPVEHEGIALQVAQLVTVPADARPGDEYVELHTRLENTGEKDAKAARITLRLPEQITHSYSDANQRWIGRLNAGESKEIVLYVDVDDHAGPGTYELDYLLDYQDLDSNTYGKEVSVPLLLKPRPYMQITAVEAEGLAGETVQMRVTVTNEGSETAEAVDARIIKQSSQPFAMDVRSQHLGELAPGESRVAIFDIEILPDAQIREHDLMVQLRAKGDSEEGDDNIYMVTEHAPLRVTGKTRSPLLLIGLVLAAIVLVALAVKRWKR